MVVPVGTKPAPMLKPGPEPRGVEQVRTDQNSTRQIHAEDGDYPSLRSVRGCNHL
ncbi:hypothetical protein SAMN05444166_1295 [Singulisphaera sp. GP187]|nr:hypothetical protein SAMN05444166_1295 [Singulisphaera sp. GP187]